jgi:hypothetical protein
MNYVNRSSGHYLYINTPHDIFNSQYIFIATTIFDVAFESYDFKKVYVYIPNRRIQIPMIFTQLRDYT